MSSYIHPRLPTSAPIRPLSDLYPLDSEDEPGYYHPNAVLPLFQGEFTVIGKRGDEMMKLAVLLLAGMSALVAQEFRGTISGKVLDPQQAAVPGAKVVATETE